VSHLIDIDTSSHDRMMKRYSSIVAHMKPRFAKSRAVEDEDEPRLCIEGIAVLTEHPIADKNGQILVFDPHAFDEHVASGRKTEVWLGHDSKKVVGSNVQLCLLNNGVAFRLPLTNKSYAATIKQMVESGKQADDFHRVH
jgi:phage head maturation protease